MTQIYRDYAGYYYIKSVLVGTEVHITQEGIPEVIPVEACYLGWQESLSLLTLLIEAEIPDQ